MTAGTGASVGERRTGGGPAPAAGATPSSRPEVAIDLSLPAPPGRVTGQVARLTAGRVTAAGLSALWMVVAARALPVAELGDLALLLAVGLVFGTVSDGGLGIVLTDVVASDPRCSRDALSIVLRKRLVLGMLASAGATVAYLAAARDASMIVPLVFSVSIVSTALHSAITSMLRGLGRVVPDAVNELVSRLAVLLGGAWLLAAGGGLLSAVTVYALVDLASVLGLAPVALRVGRGDRVPDRRAFSARRASPVALSNAVGTLYYRVDVWLLAVLAGSTVTARYASSYRLLDGLLLPAGAIAAMSVPSTAGLGARSSLLRLRRFALAAVAVTVPGAAGLALFAGPALGLAFGPSYRSAAGVLCVLLLGAIPSAAAAALGPKAALVAPRRTTTALAGCLALDVVLNLALVPRYGAVAAAWVTVVCQTLLLVRLADILRLRGPAAGGG